MYCLLPAHLYCTVLIIISLKGHNTKTSFWSVKISISVHIWRCPKLMLALRLDLRCVIRWGSDCECWSGATLCPKVSAVERSGLVSQWIVTCQQPIQMNRLRVALFLDWLGLMPVFIPILLRSDEDHHVYLLNCYWKKELQVWTKIYIFLAVQIFSNLPLRFVIMIFFNLYIYICVYVIYLFFIFCHILLI